MARQGRVKTALVDHRDGEYTFGKKKAPAKAASQGRNGGPRGAHARASPSRFFR